MKNEYNGRNGNGYQPLPPPSRDITGGAKEYKFCTVYLIAVVVSFMLLLVLASCPAQASEQCKDWSIAAERIMQARMEHENKDVMLARLRSANLPEQVVKGFTMLINSAYSIPIQNKIEDKLFLIDKFGTEVFIDCLNNTAENI